MPARAPVKVVRLRAIIVALTAVLRRHGRRPPRALVALLVLGLARAAAADPTPPIRLAYVEGDYGGVTTIRAADGERVLGVITYRQHRLGDVLRIERVARFSDGSSDEDKVDVRVGTHLEAIGGRSLIRDTTGAVQVEMKVDVEGRRLRGFYLDDGERIEVDEEADIGPGTYWGPLYMLVVKNFAANARDGTLVVQSVVQTPKPRVLDMELTRDGSATVSRPGLQLEAERVTLLPTVHFLIDPILQRLVPKTVFLMAPGDPPFLARFDGPRNYEGQMIRLE